MQGQLTTNDFRMYGSGENFSPHPYSVSMCCGLLSLQMRLPSKHTTLISLGLFLYVKIENKNSSSLSFPEMLEGLKMMSSVVDCELLTPLGGKLSLGEI